MKYTKKQRVNATYKTLRKWENRVVGSIIDDRSLYYDNTCGFCRLFSDNRHCKGCPVAFHSGDYACDNTPYSDTWFAEPQSNWDEFMYLLNIAYFEGLEGKYMGEI